MGAYNHGENTSLDTLCAFLEQEKSYTKSLKSPIQNSKLLLEWYQSMAVWSYTVARFIKMKPDFVEISLNTLYRYVSSIDEGHKIDALKFQLIAMTSLYLASKLHAEKFLAPRHLERLGRKKFTTKDIVEMELKILFELKWKVNPPTIMIFASCLIDLIPKFRQDSQLLLKLVEIQVQVAMCKAYFMNTWSSEIALAAVLNALEASSIRLSGNIIEILLRAINLKRNSAAGVHVFHIKKLLRNSIALDSMHHSNRKQQLSASKSKDDVRDNVSFDAQSSPITVISKSK